jgi:hypothetical protein
MEKSKQLTKQFVSNVMEQEYAKAQEILQHLVNEKIKQKIRKAKDALNND